MDPIYRGTLYDRILVAVSAFSRRLVYVDGGPCQYLTVAAVGGV